MEETTPTDNSASGEREDESSDAVSSEEDSSVTFRSSETSAGEENAEVVLWGKIGSHGASEPLAIYWSFDMEEDEDSSENNELLSEDFIVSLANEDVGTSEFDPSLDRERFLEQILSHSVNDSAVPQASIDQYKSHLASYVNETRVDWLIDFVRNQDESQLENWVEPLLDQFFQEGIQYYRINAGFADADGSIERDVSEIETEEDSESSLNTESDENTDVSFIDVSFVTDPSSGVRAPDLRVGEDVHYRILEPAVEDLPENMIDRSRSNPASLPLVGQIVDIEDNPEIANQIEGDPEDYRLISVNVESSVRGKGLVFKENRIKVDDGTGDAEADVEDDLILLGTIIGVLLVIVTFILVL
jgi:hypothetical protein